MENNKQDKCSVDDYIKNHCKNGDELYVSNISNCKDDEVEYIILVESPHKDELEKKIPLVGKSGRSVSKFLFEIENKSMGELIKEGNADGTHGMKIAIVNVSNIPLQRIQGKNDDQAVIDDLEKMRNECEILESLKDNLKENLERYENVKHIIVCGNFAGAYFDAIKGALKIKPSPLYVPHPSYDQWNFIYKYKDNIVTLKEMFDKTSS